MAHARVKCFIIRKLFPERFKRIILQSGRLTKCLALFWMRPMGAILGTDRFISKKYAIVRFVDIFFLDKAIFRQGDFLTRHFFDKAIFRQDDFSTGRFFENSYCFETFSLNPSSFRKPKNRLIYFCFLYRLLDTLNIYFWSPLNEKVKAPVIFVNIFQKEFNFLEYTLPVQGDFFTLNGIWNIYYNNKNNKCSLLGMTYWVRPRFTVFFIQDHRNEALVN